MESTKQIKIEIRNRWTGSVVFEYTKEGNTITETVLEAIRRDANLRDANLCGANLCGANLRDANLRSANLYGADLRDANLRNANLCDANLRDANLRDADLRGANLCDADLRGADLRDANLSGANLGFDCCFARVKGQPIYQVCGVGLSRRTLTLNAKGLRNDWVWFAGCSRGNEKDLRKAVEGKYGKDCDYMDAIEFLIKTAKRHSGDFKQEA